MEEPRKIFDRGLVVENSMDLVGLLRSEISDMLDKDYVETVLGPVAFGEGNFDVVRDERNGKWVARGKAEIIDQDRHGRNPGLKYFEKED